MEKGGRVGIGTGGNDKSPTTGACQVFEIQDEIVLPREMISVAEI
jgi:hypothetical protein